jgi:glycosyltransferase involved in cell wall biosynthesis
MKYKFSLFHSFSYPLSPITSLYAKMRKKKHIVSEFSHVVWLDRHNRWEYKILFHTQAKIALKLCDFITTPTNFIKIHMINSGIPKQKIGVIYHGIPPVHDVNIGSHADILTNLGEHLLITTVCRVVPSKNIHHMICCLDDMVKSFPLIKYVVAGPVKGSFNMKPIKNNSYFSLLVHIINKKNLKENVIFLDNIDTEELIKLLQKTTIFVFLSNKEAFGLALVWALALGLPIVAYNLPPMNEILNDDCAELISNRAQLKDAIIKLLVNSSLRELKSINAKKLYHSRYTLNKMLASYERVYDSLTS